MRNTELQHLKNNILNKKITEEEVRKSIRELKMGRHVDVIIFQTRCSRYLLSFSLMTFFILDFILQKGFILTFREDQDQDQDSLLVKRRNDNHSPGPVIRELVPSSHQKVNLATQSSASSADEIRESGRAFQSLIVWGKKLPL